MLVLFLFFPNLTSAEEPANIHADHLEYISESNTYLAKGSVKITFDSAILYADEMHLDGNTSDAVIIGNVKYEEPNTLIHADRIEMNLKTKRGTMFNSVIFSKGNNFHIYGSEINKTGDTSFSIDKASITTCDADPPAWHISASDIKAETEDGISAWHSTLRFNNTPVLYSPYLWAPLKRERQTGLLFPLFGYSSKRGQYYKQGLFWAIKENQDATLYLDYYSDMGLAEGLDYRYAITPDINGEFWIYHVRDDESSSNLMEIKSYHNYQTSNNISGYLKLNLVNKYDYYEIMDSTSLGRVGFSTWEPGRFGFASEERLQKYLESDLHVSKSFLGGRAYFLAQGRQNLEGSSNEVPQSFPEIAFILNTMSKKHFSFNLAVKGNNFWREEGQRGQRIDIIPNVYFSYGRLITLTQRVSLRETAYFLSKPTLNKNRLVADFGTSVSTKFFKKYKNVVNIIEPSLEYTYIPPFDNDNIPFFNSIDLISRTSSIEYSLTNRVSGINSYDLEARLRLSQSYNLLDVDKEFSPILAESTLLSKRIDLSLNASYDVHDKELEETIASVRLKALKGYIGLGKNFRNITNLDQYTFEGGIFSPIRLLNSSLPVEFHGKLWYDENGGGVQELLVSSTYNHQCWGFNVSYKKRPDEYEIIFAVELKGLGALSLGSI
jgi:LPS-assembly protein